MMEAMDVSVENSIVDVSQSLQCQESSSGLAPSASPGINILHSSSAFTSPVSNNSLIQQGVLVYPETSLDSKHYASSFHFIQSQATVSFAGGKECVEEHQAHDQFHQDVSVLAKSLETLNLDPVISPIPLITTPAEFISGSQTLPQSSQEKNISLTYMVSPDSVKNTHTPAIATSTAQPATHVPVPAFVADVSQNSENQESSSGLAPSISSVLNKPDFCSACISSVHNDLFSQLGIPFYAGIYSDGQHHASSCLHNQSQATVSSAGGKESVEEHGDPDLHVILNELYPNLLESQGAASVAETEILSQSTQEKNSSLTSYMVSSKNVNITHTPESTTSSTQLTTHVPIPTFQHHTSSSHHIQSLAVESSAGGQVCEEGHQAQDEFRHSSLDVALAKSIPGLDHVLLVDPSLKNILASQQAGSIAGVQTPPQNSPEKNSLSSFMLSSDSAETTHSPIAETTHSPIRPTSSTEPFAQVPVLTFTNKESEGMRLILKELEESLSHIDEESKDSPSELSGLEHTQNLETENVQVPETEKQSEKNRLDSDEEIENEFAKLEKPILIGGPDDTDFKNYVNYFERTISNSQLKYLKKNCPLLFPTLSFNDHYYNFDDDYKSDNDEGGNDEGNNDGDKDKGDNVKGDNKDDDEEEDKEEEDRNKIKK